ncbi:ABC transporter permease subunit [Phytohabitans rumicis]|uniref:ABC transporter permease n=1 Tax=Phytohabitans rumicis TaxID=1076125 RepID=A0A6V8KUY5_9ACTN|nr:ABC transporter permease subunit [Phytohabitans rumicis]GFJ86528.1 ABC transporter permease [Phytohabitans rumicis]
MSAAPHLRVALHAEWTKLRTAPGTVGLLLAVVATTVAIGALAAAATPCPATGCELDPTRLSLTGVQLGQAVVAILAVQAIGGEYGTGMVRVSLTAMPHRVAMLTAKAIILVSVVTAAAAVAVPASLLFGGLALPDGAEPPAGGGAVLRAAVGSVLYLALIALLSLGIATAARNAAAAVGLVLALLYVYPLVALAFADQDWQRRLEKLGPATAGLAVRATTGLDDLPIGPWKGLGVLAAWAAAALVTGALLLHRRDA